MKTLMILGGSNCQKNAVLAAKRRGYRTVLVDYYEHPPAATLTDIHIRRSTFDIPACIEVAQQYQVDGVMTMGTDQPVFTAAKVAAACGLPSLISPDTALAVTDKRVMKAVLDAHHIPVAPYRLINCHSTAAALDGLKPPYVLKPLDSQGQRGIFKLWDKESVFAQLNHTLSFSRQDQALVEEFYPSNEITVSGWIVHGILYILTVTDRQLYDDPTHIGVCVGHRFSSIHMAQYAEICALSEQVAAAFAIPNGPFYLQLLIGAQGLIVNELACRIGGAFEDVFIPWLTGFNILDAVLSSALGESISCHVPETLAPFNNSRQVSVQLLFCKSGQVEHITPIETLCALPGVLDAGYNYALGDVLPPLENATARFGHCVLTAEDGDIDARLKLLYHTFCVQDSGGKNLVIPRNFLGHIPSKRSFS